MNPISTDFTMSQNILKRLKKLSKHKNRLQMMSGHYKLTLSNNLISHNLK